MSGADFLFWLEGIWFDLTNLDTADLPSLFFRIALLCLAVWGTVIFVRVVFSVTRSLFRDLFVPLFRFVGRTVSAPFRVPAEALRKRRIVKERERNLREWQEREDAKARQERAERADEEAKEQERLAQIERMLRPD